MRLPFAGQFSYIHECTDSEPSRSKRSSAIELSWARLDALLAGDEANSLAGLILSTNERNLLTFRCTIGRGEGGGGGEMGGGLAGSTASIFTIGGEREGAATRGEATGTETAADDCVAVAAAAA